jgi:hypothetical protein
MNPHSYDGPGGEGCPLERFRARAIVYGLGGMALAVFAGLMWIVWRGGAL